LRGNQFTAGLSLKLWNWRTDIAYVCQFNRGYQDKNFPASHMGFVGFTYQWEAL